MLRCLCVYVLNFGVRNGFLLNRKARRETLRVCTRPKGVNKLFALLCVLCGLSNAEGPKESLGEFLRNNLEVKKKYNYLYLIPDFWYYSGGGVNS